MYLCLFLWDILVTGNCAQVQQRGGGQAPVQRHCPEILSPQLNAQHFLEKRTQKYRWHFWSVSSRTEYQDLPLSTSYQWILCRQESLSPNYLQCFLFSYKFNFHLVAQLGSTTWFITCIKQLLQNELNSMINYRYL